MVSDKFQVRSLGPNNPLTQQPIKGRKAGGGIRFGEMERDALIAHGAAFLLHDRLHMCSDNHVAGVCSKCGSLISPVAVLHAPASAAGTKSSAYCRVCNSSSGIERIALPFVFKCVPYYAS